jgi:putative transposase
VATKVYGTWGKDPDGEFGRREQSATVTECRIDDGGGYAKKGKRLLCKPPQVIYAFIEEQLKYPVAKWASFFEVSKSGYYRWKQVRGTRLERDAAYRERIRKIFKDSKGTYGAERISAELRKNGHHASYRKVKREMNEMGLRSVHQRRVKSLTDSRKARGDEYVNLLKDKVITAPFTALSSDISYIPTDEGFLYLCQIKDIVSNIVLAEHMSERMTRDLVLTTIRAAHKRYQLCDGTIFHSDRGSQYTSNEVKALLSKLRYRQSFSRVGMPGDNAWSESFFSILKKEAVFPVRFHSRDDARQAIFAYIEAFYNRRRIQKTLGYLSPVQWLDRYLDVHLPRTA